MNKLTLFILLAISHTCYTFSLWGSAQPDQNKKTKITPPSKAPNISLDKNPNTDSNPPTTNNQAPFMLIYGDDEHSQKFMDKTLSALLKSGLDDLFSDDDTNQNEISINQVPYINKDPKANAEKLLKNDEGLVIDEKKVDLCALQILKKMEAWSVVRCLVKKRLEKKSQFKVERTAKEKSDMAYELGSLCLAENRLIKKANGLKNCLDDPRQVNFQGDSDMPILLPSNIPKDYIKPGDMTGTVGLVHRGEVIDAEKMEKFQENPIDFLCSYMDSPAPSCIKEKISYGPDGDGDIDENSESQKKDDSSEILSKNNISTDCNKMIGKKRLKKDIKGENGSKMKLYKTCLMNNKVKFHIRVQIPINEENSQLSLDLEEQIKEITKSENMLSEIGAFNRIKKQILAEKNKKVKDTVKQNKRDFKGNGLKKLEGDERNIDIEDEMDENIITFDQKISGEETADGFVSRDYKLIVDKVDDDDAADEIMPMITGLGRNGQKYPSMMGKVHTNRSVTVHKGPDGEEHKTVVESKTQNFDGGQVQTITVNGDNGLDGLGEQGMNGFGTFGMDMGKIPGLQNRDNNPQLGNFINMIQQLQNSMDIAVKEVSSRGGMLKRMAGDDGQGQMITVDLPMIRVKEVEDEDYTGEEGTTEGGIMASDKNIGTSDNFEDENQMKMSESDFANKMVEDGDELVIEHDSGEDLFDMMERSMQIGRKGKGFKPKKKSSLFDLEF